MNALEATEKTQYLQNKINALSEAISRLEMDIDFRYTKNELEELKDDLEKECDATQSKLKGVVLD